MEADLPTTQDYELWVLLHQTVDAMVKARDKELEPLGLTRMQNAVLYIVKTIDGPATPAEISRWLFREAQTVSGLLDRMESQGLVRRVKDLERKNQVRVALTEKGEEVFRRTRDLNVIRRILASLSQKDLDDLRAPLETLRNKALEESGVRHRFPYP